jgi:hypothetical protein
LRASGFADPHNFPIATPCVASHLLFVRGQFRFSLTGPVRMPEPLHQTEFIATGGAREGGLGSEEHLRRTAL